MPTANGNGNNNKVTQENLETNEEDEDCSSPSKRARVNRDEVQVRPSNSDSDPGETEDPEAQNQVNEADSSSEDTQKVSTSVLRLTLGNYKIMENLVKFLDDQDLDLWCEACKSFKLLNFEDIDSCCWEERALKLAVAYEQSLIPLEDQFPGKTFREIFLILKYDVDSLVIQLRELLDDNWAVPSPAEIAVASSLSYYGFLGPDPTKLYPIEVLQLFNMDLTSVWSKHLDSLASSVTRRLVIMDVRGCKMVSLLDSVQCQVLCLHREEKLDSEETSALVRAMENQVEKVVLGHEKMTMLDVKALTQYSGRGQCSVLHMVECDADKEKYAEEMKNWARDKNWSWEADGDNGESDLHLILYMFERV